MRGGDLTNPRLTGIMPLVCGAVAQLGERYNRTVEAKGSNPFSSTSPPTQRINKTFPGL